MKRNLESAIEEMVKLDNHNNDLIQENQNLKIQYSAQENDREAFVLEIARYKREIQKLKKDLQQAQEDVTYYKVLAEENQSSFRKDKRVSMRHMQNKEGLDSEKEDGTREHTVSEREVKLMDDVARLRKLLNQEKRSLK